MAATYVKGDVHTTQYTAGANIASGDVIPLGSTNEKRARIGVALTAIANGSTGSVAITGCWRFPKVPDADIAHGESVGWDHSEKKVDDNAFAGGAAGDVKEFGMADSAGAATTTSIDVWIDAPGTLKNA
jgi:predicted RecA/RadA family phage recombinase